MVLLDVLQVQDYIVPSQATPVVLFHHALTPMVLLQTTQRVFVALHHAQQIQVYIVTSRATLVVLFHRALRPMALLQTTQRANVALRRAHQRLGCIVTLAAVPAPVEMLAPTPMER